MVQKICAFVLFKLLGWKIIGEPPRNVPKYLFVMVPHTSNWDFAYGWLGIRTLGLDVTIFAKDSFYVWPLNYVCDFFGVKPVNRRESTNFVGSITRQFKEQDRLAVVITPEGTRSYQSSLKSGYYHLARNAAVPIVLAGMNYQNKTFTLMPPRLTFATFQEDSDDLVEFCKLMNAKHPEKTFQ